MLPKILAIGRPRGSDLDKQGRASQLQSTERLAHLTSDRARDVVETSARAVNIGSTAMMEST